MVRFRKITLRVRRVSTCGLVVAVASCGGGGDDGGTTSPGTVARVEITSPSNRLEVGQNMQVTVRYFDASSSQLTGRTISYSTSNSSLATVSQAGLVTATAAGNVSVIATVDGHPGKPSAHRH
jgi:uncharacterized protein YjdB